MITKAPISLIVLCELLLSLEGTREFERFLEVSFGHSMPGVIE